MMKLRSLLSSLVLSIFIAGNALAQQSAKSELKVGFVPGPLHLEFRRPSLVEVRVLLIMLVALLCILALAPVGSRHSPDEQAMLSAMFAAGGMPMIQSVQPVQPARSL